MSYKKPIKKQYCLDNCRFKKSLKEISTQSQLNNEHCLWQSQHQILNHQISKKWLKKHASQNVIFGLLAMVLSFICMPAFAATENNSQNEVTIASSQTQSENRPANENPDNLIEYVEQEIDTVQREGIDLPDSAREVFKSDDKNAVQQAGQMQGDMSLSGDYNANYYPVDELNAGLPSLARAPNLVTPLSMLEFFQSAVMKEQYELAAQALNMNLLDSATQSSRSGDLAQRLDFLLSTRGLYVFDDLPDRPDGLLEPPTGSTSSIRGIPRRSIQLGYINYRERQVPLFVERVRVKDAAPIWVFSAQTVGNIDNLYEQYKPPEFAQYLPDWMTIRFFGMAVWEFLILISFLLVTMGFGWLLSKGVGVLVNRHMRKKDDEDAPSKSRKGGCNGQNSG